MRAESHLEAAHERRNLAPGRRPALLLVLLGVLAGFGEARLASAPAFHPMDCSQLAKGWNQFKPDECWAVVPRGRQTLEGVPFQLDGTLEVTGLGSARDGRGFYPTRIVGIPVNHKGHRLHVLSGTGYNAPDGTPLGKLLAHYADGSEHAFYLLYSVNTRNWWREPTEKDAVSDPNAAIAWTYTQPPWNLRLYKAAFDNPYPEREIKTIDLVSLLSRATPVVVALTLEENPAAPLATAPATPTIDESACRRELRLRFLDHDGQPVRDAVATLTLSEASRTFDFGTNRSDPRGEMVVDYPATQVRELAAFVRAPNCLPARFSLLANAEAGNLPREHVVQLEHGVRIGGFVRDSSGLPIAGARVSVNSVTRDEVGQSIELETDVATTDATGRWSSASVSADFKSLTFKLSHPDFRPAEYYFSDTGGGAQEGSKADLLAAKAALVMEPGTTIAGAVADNNGKPLEGAEVLLRDNADPPKDRFAQSDAAGHFKFVLMEAGQGIVAVAAKGFAPQSANVTFESGVKPLAFKLEPAKPLRGRVVDAAGKPLAGAAVSLASWNELPFPKWQTRTDAKGQFTWDSAPAADAVYSAAKDGYVAEQPTLNPGDEDVTFVLKAAPSITGKVVDAATKEPINEFQVIVGRTYGVEDVNWERYRPVRGSAGTFSYRDDQNINIGGRLRLLVEAKGYLPQVSAPLSSGGWVTNDFALEKGNGPHGVVKLPGGQPAAGVRVALLTGDYVQLRNAEVQRGNSGNTDTTDAEGKFALPAAYATEVVAASSQGYAEAQLARLDTNLTLTLQPWGRLEGTVRNGRRPATNEWVMVAPSRGGVGMHLQYDFDTYRTQADEQGHFLLTNVPPGERFLTRLYPMVGNRGWMWSHGQPITVKVGEATRLDFGGQGRTIIGKVVPNEQRDIPWQSGHHTLGSVQPQPPSQFRTREEIEAWNDSPEVKKARADYRYYSVQFGADGSFHIDDVPPGKYQLNLMFNEPGAQNFASGAFIGSIRQEVEVPDMPNGAIDEPLDLGRLDLVVQSQH